MTKIEIDAFLRKYAGQVKVRFKWRGVWYGGSLHPKLKVVAGLHGALRTYWPEIRLTFPEKWSEETKAAVLKRIRSSPGWGYQHAKEEDQ